ncbi:MAG TPA: hypothetical protein VFD80_02480, partial [Flavobacteriaceae bacterium]|nr:hypothetical protein [Flavobacteriaceae bacterium]
TYDANNNRYLIAADGKIFAIDENTGASSVLAEVKFDGKEDPTDIEIRDNGILLTSDQNMMMLNWDGSEQFHKYYAAPGKSAAGAILMGITAVATAATAAASYNKALQNRNQLGQFTDKGERYKNFGNQMVAHSAASINEMLKKFNATAATENDQFILTKLDDGVGLVKVNKDDGSVSKEIVLKDKKPEYEIDDFAGVLYYKADNSTIYLYDLKK